MSDLYKDGVKKFDFPVRCPCCGGDNVHISRMIVNQNGNVDEITKDGIKKLNVEPKFRGSVVKVVFWCECGRSFARIFHFHKGSTYEELQDVEGQEELWRD